jgi:uncharacterized protein YndB with AHSA1/START domain
MIDFTEYLNGTDREVSRTGAEPEREGETVSVLLRRTYQAEAADVWDALTDPERLRRWFLPVSGDLREGGTFALEGNASGDILACEPPHLLRVTFGGPESIVEVRLRAEKSGAAASTVFELEHAVPIAMAGSGAGALWVGPGWDGAVLGLGLYLYGDVAPDPVAAASSPEAQEYSRRSIDLWATAIRESRTATGEQIDEAVAVSLSQFAPDQVAPDQVGARGDG